MSVLRFVIVFLVLGVTDARSTQNAHLRHKRAITKLSDVELTGTSGHILSPNYPNNYAVDTEKTYIIQFPDPQAYYKVTFEVIDMSIELQDSCSWDYFLINAGGIGKLCGEKTHTFYTVDEQQGSVTAKFHSDYMVDDRGFDIEYTLEQLSDGCTGSPCDQGSCEPVGRYDFTCVCDPGFTGLYCESLLGSCINDSQCGSHGKCDSYDCSCYDGYTGMHCEYAPDCQVDADCGNGYCGDNYFCTCTDGYMGSNCDVVCMDDTDCNGHGMCTGGYCSCNDGYTGMKCTEAPVCEVNAQCGHGYCDNYNCVCTDIYVGQHCDAVCISENDCSGNGICMDGSCLCDVMVCFSDEDCNFSGDCYNNTCYCFGDRTGTNCETQLSQGTSCTVDSECMNGNICVNAVCVNGNVPITACYTDADCQNGGICMDSICKCNSGYYGNHCEMMSMTACTLDNECMNGDICISGICITGTVPITACYTDADCQNGGICMDSICKCNSGYYGNHCEMTSMTACTIDSECMNGDICISGICITGTVPITACYTDADCQNGGICMDSICKCNSGYYGNHCEMMSSWSRPCEDFNQIQTMAVMYCKGDMDRLNSSVYTGESPAEQCSAYSQLGMCLVSAFNVDGCDSNALNDAALANSHLMKQDFSGFDPYQCAHSNTGGSIWGIPTYSISGLYELLQLAWTKSSASKAKMQQVQQKLDMVEELANLYK